ncbi:MAG: ketosynthase [Lysobacter sp.]|nr:MAG: ketosynthase [Lysobacter sp.]
MNVVAVRLLLSAAYPLLAHAASATGDTRLAAIALLDILLILLVLPLLAGRVWAWALVVASAALLWRMQLSTLLPVVLLLPPVLITAFLSWGFARTLRPGQTPLISRIVAGLEHCPAHDLAPSLRDYTRSLTRFWALLLGGLALANLALGIVAVPDGLLARLGQPSPVQVPRLMWSWFANLLDYGIVAAVFVIEYIIRMRRFPDRPYRSFPEFLRRLGALGPAFWRDVLR